MATAKSSPKYEPFERWLRSQSADRVDLSFAEIERIIGAKLPASSHLYDVHWTSDAGTRPGWAIQRAG